MGFHAMMAQFEEKEAPQEEAQMGSLRILSAMKAKTKGPEATIKGLQYVQMKVNGLPVRALVDSGATHNFVSVDEAKRLGLKMVKKGGTIKAVNSGARPISGMARDVKAKIREWVGVVDLSVIPMDDFKLVLGMEFMDKVKAFPMPFANSLCILDGGRTSMVPTERSAKVETKTLSVMQLEKGCKGHKADSKEEMPRELPKELPPRKEVECKMRRAEGAVDASRRKAKATSTSQHKSYVPKRRDRGTGSTKDFNTYSQSRRVRGRRDEGVASLGGGECDVHPEGSLKSLELSRNLKYCPRKRLDFSRGH